MKIEVELVEEKRILASETYDGIATTFYRIYLKHLPIVVGRIDLRQGSTQSLYYYGNIGYMIHPLFRGHHYAYQACLLLFAKAKKEFGMSELWITCSPENKASYKTLMRLKGEYIETVDVPLNHELYQRGEKKKCIFRYKL